MTNETYANEHMLQSVFDAFPALLFIVDSDMKIQECNAAATALLGEKELFIKRRGGQALHCIHSTETTAGCGRSPSCNHCTIRNSVNAASEGNRVVRRRTRIDIKQDGEVSEIYALISASPFQFTGKPFVLLIIEDISEIAELRRMIPICSVCKEVRDEKEAWSRLEVYFKENWDVDFSHGLCPKCYQQEMKRMASEE